MSIEGAPSSAVFTTASNDTHDDRPTTMSVNPMTIDDFHDCRSRFNLMNINDDSDNENNHHNDAQMVQYHQFVDYHAAIILYNFGVIHQCLGMTDDDPVMMDVDVSQNHRSRACSIESSVVGTSSSATGTEPISVSMTIDDENHMSDDVPNNVDRHDCNEDVVSPERLLASYKIQTNTLSWIHELIRPIMEDVMNEEQDNHISSSRNTEMSSSSIETTPGDLYYLNKYLQVMVLINYHILDIIDTLHFPDGPYMYYHSMMNEILNFILYLEIFYPTITSSSNNNLNNHYGGNTRGSASPAA
jgi:hypothetical protein